MTFLNFNDEIRANRFRTVMLFLSFYALIVVLGAVFGLYIGDMVIGTIIVAIAGVIYSLIAYFAGANMILSMSHAKEATKKEYPHLVHSVEGLSIAAGIPVPKIYVIQDSAINAFATGRDPKHGVVCFTTGILEKMDRQELEGVIAHELSHIMNHDIKVMMLASVMVGVVTLISDIMIRSFIFGAGNRKNTHPAVIIIGLVLAILAPIFAFMIQMAISRKREFLADASAAKLTRYPSGLASALEKIRNDPDPLVDTANRATAHLFISTPFRKKSGWTINLFATHPPLEERIKKLQAM